MHELSVVQNIVELARDHLQKVQARRVDRIELEIGMLAGIEMDAFHFAWEATIPHTELAGAALHLLRPAARARCHECGNTFPVDQLYDPCPDCGAFFSDLISGRELRVRSLTLS